MRASPQRTGSQAAQRLEALVKTLLLSSFVWFRPRPVFVTCHTACSSHALEVYPSNHRAASAHA
jgi:hypothetical protein